MSKSMAAFIAAILLFSFQNCKKNESKIAQPEAQKPTTSGAIDSRYQPKNFVEIKHPDWAKNATIYEVNVRQYTPEGTFKAFEAHLPRLKALGADILWFMPIHPIGEKNRKGKMGSYYAVKDYLAVNPEFGTMDEFKSLVKKCHEMGFRVILDWVGNHTAWDNQLAIEHPDWYSKTREGNFQPTPWFDWDDIIDLDYDRPEVRKYMTEALKFWVKECDIDGYRCDTGGFIPTDFWDNARAEMDAIKPVFMLAEFEARDLHRRAFDATYAWSFWDQLMLAIHEKKGAGPITGYLAQDVNTFPPDGYRMTFTDNHDKNSWEGNGPKNFGNGLGAAIVLTGTVNGMLLCYSGQEAGLNKSLLFFEKDEIKWRNDPANTLFTMLFKLKHENQALWNGLHGGSMVKVSNDRPNEIVSFSREKNGDKVLPIVNVSDKKLKIKLDSKYEKGNYVEWFSGKQIELKGDDVFELPPFGYLVLTMDR